MKKAIEKLIREYPGATFLVDGDSLRGDIRKIPDWRNAEFLFIRDHMAVGRCAPEILSPEFVALRAHTFADPFEAGEYMAERYEREMACELRKLAQKKQGQIILLQYDCYLSQIWQLTMMAYLEQLGYTNPVIRVRFRLDIKEFECVGMECIPVAGSNAAYFDLVCCHRKVSLKKQKISTAAVKCYLDLQGENRVLKRYIYRKSAAYDNPYHATGMFLRDFPKWGLGDEDFLKIAYKVLSQDERYKEKTKRWLYEIRKLRKGL